MCAVLDAAISDFMSQFMKKGQRARRVAQEAEEWMLRDDEEWPFSFINICAALELDAEYIRAGLQAWKDNPPVQPPPRRQRSVPTHRPLKVVS